MPPRADDLQRTYEHLRMTTQQEMQQLNMSKPHLAINKSHQAWIAGLRGLAALAVAIFHYVTPELWDLYSPGHRTWSLVFIRLFTNGLVMVRLFFILSGYCIAIGFHQFPKGGASTGKAGIAYYRKLTSAVFRRTLRLYIPFFGVAMVCHVCWFFGLYAEEPPDISVACPNVRPWSAPWSHITCAAAYLLDSCNILDLQWTLSLNNSLWTLPLELRGSIALYATFLGLANTAAKWRIIILGILSLYHLWYGTKDMTGFFAGAVVAEIHHYFLRKGKLGQTPASAEEKLANHDLQKKPQHSRYATALSLAALGFALYLLSLPIKQWNDPVDDLPPEYNFLKVAHLPHWTSAGDYTTGIYNIGATILLAALHGLPRLRQWLSARPLQFLGNISFSLFMVHFAIKRMCQIRVLHFLHRLSGVDPQGDLSSAVMLMQALVFTLYCTISISFASFLTRILEEPSVEWAAKAEKWVESQEPVNCL